MRDKNELDKLVVFLANILKRLIVLLTPQDSVRSELAVVTQSSQARKYNTGAIQNGISQPKSSSGNIIRQMI